MPPKYDELEDIFNTELPQVIDRCKTKIDLAFEIFLEFLNAVLRLSGLDKIKDVSFEEKQSDVTFLTCVN
jgi:hypothetical protein